MNQILLQYSYLQVMDLLTTVAFLMQGVQEGNPVVRTALKYAPTPLSGLLLVKLLAVALGIYCWRAGKMRLLTRMNVLFALVVAWNVASLILHSASPEIY